MLSLKEHTVSLNIHISLLLKTKSTKQTLLITMTDLKLTKLLNKIFNILPKNNVVQTYEIKQKTIFMFKDRNLYAKKKKKHKPDAQY